MPSLQPFRTGEIFRKATEAMGLHPYPTPVAANSVPYNGFPANTYTPWSGVGFGPICDDRWHPALTSVPEALATGSFDLKTHCRVVRVLTDVDGHAGGVEYVGAGGEPRVQVASTVLLCGYTYENVRLMFLSRTGRRRDWSDVCARESKDNQLGGRNEDRACRDGLLPHPDLVKVRHSGQAFFRTCGDERVS